MLGLILSVLLNVFVPPVDGPIKLAGNFGEPRPNHFHGGLDVKTDNVEGKHVYAIADGYVSRVTVGLYGFGNAVYITHPTGQTSVYCHLKSFSPRIKAALRRYQYRHKTCVADARLKPLDVPVSRGQFIALSGNTGHSTGPHLHLELHDTRSWDMLDPYDVLGAYIADSLSPQVHAVMAVPQSGGMFDGSSSKRSFRSSQHVAWGRVGFALWADDYMQDSYNHFGLRYTSLLVDGREVFRADVSRIPMSHNRMVNAWGDYEHFLRHRTWYLKSYVEPGCRLPVLWADEQRGIINFNEERDYHLEYILRDHQGNEQHYTFTVRGQKVQPPSHSVKNGQLFRWNKTNSYSCPGMQLVVPYGCLAADVAVQPFIQENPRSSLSSVYSFAPSSMPLLTDAELSLYAMQEVADPHKLFISNDNGAYLGGRYQDGWVTGRIPDLFGHYRLVYDDDPPKVQLMSLNDRAVISAVDYGSGIASWTATVDGRFVVFDASDRTSNYVCNFKETWLRPTGKHHQLRFVVTDNRQNTQTFETSFQY